MKAARYAVVAVLLLGGGALLTGAAAYVAGTAITSPAQGEVGPPPPALPFEPVTFRGSGGSLLKGWLLKRDKGQGVIVLMHGIYEDRRIMLGRAHALSEAGYSVLLFDFQAHGESEGQAITFGHLEARDARSAVAFARSRLPGEPVGVIGTSMGGAACLLGDGPLDVDAMVLEGVYPDIDRALRNRLRMFLGPPGTWLHPLFTTQLELRLGIEPEALRPAARIGAVTSPVLIIAGTEDRRTTPGGSKRLYAAAPAPKHLWLVEGARHEDLHRFAGQAYETRVTGFFERYLSRHADEAGHRQGQSRQGPHRPGSAESSGPSLTGPRGDKPPVIP